MELETQSQAHQALTQWVLSRAGPNGRWSQDRDSTYKARWESYYRLWRGIWSKQDSTRGSERSRMIAPALQQAIESVTSEIESAILDRANFFDMSDDPQDLHTTDDLDVGLIRSNLTYDMKAAGYELALAEVFLNGSMFGTGIGKVDLVQRTVVNVSRDPETGEVDVQETTEDTAKLTSVLPQEFAIDPAARSVNEGLGFAHNYSTPRHGILEGMANGTYREVPLHAQEAADDPIESDETMPTNQDAVNITDYRGKVPRAMLAEYQADIDPDVTELFPEEADDTEAGRQPTTFDEDDLVEAFVTIVNGAYILKAVENPMYYKDRLMMAYRHEIVPGQFWGRGSAEKGYNSQKALDASMRARIDGLALTVHPMMGIDAASMPRGFKFTVRPGRTILTNGDPANILRPMNFGQMDPNIFTDNAELERMVAMSTGGFDSAAPVKVNNRNETASGMSMQMGGFVKRSKRTIRNVEAEMIIPLVTQTARLLMQFRSDRYPVSDYTFKAVSVLGTMARELEQNQYATMMNTVPENSPAFWMLMKSFYESSALATREEMIPLINDLLKKSTEPPPPDPKVEMKAIETKAKIAHENARIKVEFIRAQAEIAREANAARMAPSVEAKNESSALLDLAKAEAAEAGTQMDAYQHKLDSLERMAGASSEQTNNVIERASTVQLGLPE